MEWTRLPRPTAIVDLHYEGGKLGKLTFTPGTCFLLGDGSVVLVGNINALGGRCDDCEDERVAVAMCQIDYESLLHSPAQVPPGGTRAAQPTVSELEAGRAEALAVWQAHVPACASCAGASGRPGCGDGSVLFAAAQAWRFALRAARGEGNDPTEETEG